MHLTKGDTSVVKQKTKSESRRCKRFHITLQVKDLQSSIHEYSKILGESPCCVVAGRLALWRTNELNFLLRIAHSRSKQPIAVLQFGWEFDHLDSAQRFKDKNGLAWLYFATNNQDDAINHIEEELEYDESKDHFLELRNPNARWNLWSSIIIVIAMAAFTIWNYESLQSFFRLDQTQKYAQSGGLAQAAEPADPSAKKPDQSLKAVGRLLKEAGYQVDYLNNRIVAQNYQQATITAQILQERILFSTYWTPDSKVNQLSGNDSIKIVNDINHEAILCRFYVDDDSDIVVEAWFSLAHLLHLQQLQEQVQQLAAAELDHAEFPKLQAKLQAELQAELQQAEASWGQVLAFWQQESFAWLRDSVLFGGSLDPKHSFSKH